MISATNPWLGQVPGSHLYPRENERYFELRVILRLLIKVQIESGNHPNFLPPAEPANIIDWRVSTPPLQTGASRACGLICKLLFQTGMFIKLQNLSQKWTWETGRGSWSDKSAFWTCVCLWRLKIWRFWRGGTSRDKISFRLRANKLPSTLFCYVWRPLQKLRKVIGLYQHDGEASNGSFVNDDNVDHDHDVLIWHFGHMTLHRTSLRQQIPDHQFHFG